MNPYHETVCFEFAAHTVPALGSVTGGTKTSLASNDDMGLASAPSATDRRRVARTALVKDANIIA